jgi:predicted MFS family arabinose efflux permease
LIALAPLSATIVLALNQSAIHVGAAVGSATGALALIYAAPAALGVTAASLTLLPLALDVQSTTDSPGSQFL